MIRHRRREGGAAGAADDSARVRTYGIWGFAALFVLIGLLGLGWLLWGPEPDEGTVLLDTPQTLPEPSGAGAGDRTSPPTTEPSGVAGLIPGTTGVTTSIVGAPSPTMPDGSTAPAGVADVVVEGETVHLRFGGPGSTQLPEGWAARVAPTTLAPAGERTLEVRVGCAASPQERLAEVAVTESEGSVIVAVAVVAPPDAAPCAGGEPTLLEVPLRAPVGDRLLVAAPAGTDLSEALGGG